MRSQALALVLLLCLSILPLEINVQNDDESLLLENESGAWFYRIVTLMSGDQANSDRRWYALGSSDAGFPVPSIY